MEQASLIKKKLEEVLEALGPTADAPAREALQEFARRLLVRGSADFLERRPVSRTAEDIRELFRLVERTPDDEIGVRVRRLPESPNRVVVETVMPDCAFIVNTVREYLHSRGFDIPQLLHPVFVAERDGEGRILRVQDRGAEGTRTSVIFVVAEGPADDAPPEELERDIRYRLGEVRKATGDFEPMVERAALIIRELEAKKEEVPWRAGEFEEIQELLRWLQEGCFLFLGYRAYRIESDAEGRQWIRVEPGSGLGILHDETASRYHEPRPLDDLPPDLKARVVGGPLLIVSKANAESPVQRRARMDYIGIKQLGPEGAVQGEHRFLGLFTSKAFSQDASEIPILRRKLREILEQEGAPRGSHDHNLILQTFNSMPKEELFLATVGELSEVIAEVMETEGADDVRVNARPDPLGRGVNLMVILPKQRFSGEVREKIQESLVQAYQGAVLNYHLALGGSDQARLHFYVSSPLSEPGAVDTQRLERLVRESVRSWEERLSDALEQAHETRRAHELADRHQADFSAEYKATVDVETAVEDIDRLESLESTGVQQVVLEEVEPARPHGFRLKIFAPRGMFVLSDVMPTMENLGLRVIEADRYDVAGNGGTPKTIHVFQVETPAEWNVRREDAEPRLAEALRAVQASEAEDDRLNALVLSAGLGWREVSVLRAYAAYAFRIGAVASRYGGQRPLTEHPTMARLLYRIFETLHDPAAEEGRRSAVRRLLDAFQDGLRDVHGIEDDRAYRRLLGLVRATLRTNHFLLRDRDEPPLLALKFDCRSIEVMPRPRPRYEVYLNGPRTEGCHLRMDAVARGGIRWSDRSEDFRVEVLGLVKTQQVKNAVIVPAGAKGAFIPRRPTESPEEAREAGLASYRSYIEALLDVTDNVVEGEVRRPEGMVVHDEADPYLVVAADKGTARFSDEANRLAAERGFWLGDAFASGGSHGYDHKELGITARGVWECVKRHFAEMGKDIGREPFTVAGIGDMSGDVFGNGMLLSDRIRLVAAFDHRHIFVDPDPDPEASHAERRRLYELPGSTWSDYEPDVLSEGGAVFERSAKRIELSEEARERLGLSAEEAAELNGDALIRAILRARVDLLWNGGIGTYVKASWETHGEVGDPGNDAVRVDAPELGARVVGEGGNLGLTQPARVEYALAGGRLNTDALDNSAGVDMSDHEVNLKILLHGAVTRGVIDREARNRLLEEVTDEVAADVLSNNYTQSLAVSLDERRVREAPGEFRDALLLLEREGLLDRQLEFLPTSEELLERQEEGKTLTRPELAVTLAYAKMHLKRALLDSELPDDPAVLELARRYFPAAVLERIPGELLETHRLRRHMVATLLTNRFVDRMGATAHLQLVRETGRPAAQVARMWYAAGTIADADALYADLRAAEARVPAGVQCQWHLEISRALERATLWLLTNADPELAVGDVIERYGEPIASLRDALPELLASGRLATLENRRALHETDGLDAKVAERMTSFPYLDELLPVAQLAHARRVPARLVGSIYFGLSDLVDVTWLREQLDRLPSTDVWQQRAAKTLSLRLEGARARMAAHILDEVEAEADVEGALAGFKRHFADDLERVRQVVEDVRAAGTVDLPGLVVAVHALEGRFRKVEGRR